MANQHYPINWLQLGMFVESLFFESEHFIPNPKRVFDNMPENIKEIILIYNDEIITNLIALENAFENDIKQKKVDYEKQSEHNNNIIKAGKLIDELLKEYKKQKYYKIDWAELTSVMQNMVSENFPGNPECIFNEMPENFKKKISKLYDVTVNATDEIGNLFHKHLKGVK